MINATYTTRIDFSVTTSVTYGVDSPEAAAQESLAPVSATAVPAGTESTNPTDSVTISPDSSRLARGAEALFTVLDANQDGSITGEEFTDGATALLRQARGRHHHHYHHRHEDRHEGGRFGGERWGGERAGGNRLTNALSNLFSSVDGDADGSLTKDELTAALTRATRPQQPATTPVTVDAPASPDGAGSVEPTSQPAVEGQSTASENIAPQAEPPVSENAGADSTTVGSGDQPVVGDPAFVVGENGGQSTADPVETAVAIPDPVVVAGEQPAAEPADVQPAEQSAAEETAQGTADGSAPATTTDAGSGATPLSLTIDYTELGRRAQSALYKLIDGNRDVWTNNTTSNGGSVNGTSNEDRIAAKIADLFAKFDANGDGSISQGEFAAGFGIDIQTSQTSSAATENDAPAASSSSTSEEPAAVTEPAVEEPAVVAQPVAAEEPVAVQEPVAEQAVGAEQAVAGESSFVAEQPAVAEAPAVAEEAAAVVTESGAQLPEDEPAVVTTSPVVGEPAVEAEPSADEPAQVPVSAEDNTLLQLADAAAQEPERAGRLHREHNRHHHHNHDSNNVGFGRPAYVAAALQRYHHHERAGRAA